MHHQYIDKAQPQSLDETGYISNFSDLYVFWVGFELSDQFLWPQIGLVNSSLMKPRRQLMQKDHFRKRRPLRGSWYSSPRTLNFGLVLEQLMEQGMRYQPESFSALPQVL